MRTSLYHGPEVDLARQNQANKKNGGYSHMHLPYTSVPVHARTLRPVHAPILEPGHAPAPKLVLATALSLVQTSSYFHPPTAVTLKVNNSADI